MANSSKMRDAIVNLIDRLNQQVWFQQIKSKWEELDPQSRIYLKFAGLGVGALLIFLVIFSSIWKVHSLKVELVEKKELLRSIQAATDEIQKLRDALPHAALDSEAGASSISGLGSSSGSSAKSGSGSSSGDSSTGSSGWSTYFESLAASLGLEKANFSIASEKKGNSNDQAKETLIELNLKHVNIKQVVRYVFSIENGQRPAKLRTLSIDTKGDMTGYLDAALAISGFTPVVPE
jgi:hypothetical protein